MTGFTNSEEVAVGKEKLVPFLLEDRLKELGGEFERGPDWGVHAVRWVAGGSIAALRIVGSLAAWQSAAAHYGRMLLLKVWRGARGARVSSVAWKGLLINASTMCPPLFLSSCFLQGRAAGDWAEPRLQREGG